MGYRDRPPWGIATADFQREGEGAETLGTYQTVFLVQEKTKNAVLNALRNGKMYASQGSYPQASRLEEFSVSSSENLTKGISGDEIALKEFPRVRISISTSVPSPDKVKIRLIRSGEMIYLFEEKLPLMIDYVDPYYKPGERIYYRMDMHGAGTIVSNPVFVKFE
jgi:ribosomal protein S16